MKTNQQTQPLVVPRFLSVILIILLLYYFFWRIGIFYIVFGWVLVHFYFSPFLTLSKFLRLLLREFRSYPNLPFTFNLAGIFNLLMKALLCFPLGTVLWLVDEYILTEWKKVRIIKPLFILGQPRSGTTKLQSIMDKDPHFHCLRTYELLFPFLSVQYLIRFLGELDTKYANGAIAKGIEAKSRVNTNASQSAKMRPIELTKAEEDDFMFQFWFQTGILIAAFFPSKEYQRDSHNFEKNDPVERRRMMKFHSQVIQKFLYLNGNGTKRYMAKWVMGWNGEVQATREAYPDAEYLIIVRDRFQSVPSWVKLVGLLAEDWTAYNFVNLRGEARDEFIRLTAEGYQQTIEFCRTIPKERLKLLKFDEFFQDMPKHLKETYKYFGWDMPKDFENYVEEQQRRQKEFVGTKLDFSQISEEEIKTLFPDLLTELF